MQELPQAWTIETILQHEYSILYGPVYQSLMLTDVCCPNLVSCVKVQSHALPWVVLDRLVGFVLPRLLDSDSFVKFHA